MDRDAQRAAELGTAVSSALTPRGGSGRVGQDIGLVLEACAAIRLPDPGRTCELRRRVLATHLSGLAADGDPRPPLPGPPPQGAELNWRWAQR
jgi:hypothetical protein